MESDDEMVVVIVGDGENDEFPAPMDIKQEAIDEEDVQKLIETATTHGEYVELDSICVKEEAKEENDKDCDECGDGDDDEEYIPQGDEDDEDIDDGDDSDDSSGNESKVKQRYKLLKSCQQKSFVKELTDQYPELEDDMNALVTTLSEIMRNVKPPPPPQDYFILNGIMFECTFCGHISETPPAAARHFQEKHGERYLVCFACGVDFRSATNLYKHEKRCVAPDAVVVLKARARALGRKGRARPYLPSHFTVPAAKTPSERKFECKMCPAKFVSKSYLQSHALLHQGMRPYRCSACPAAYTSLAALSRHRKQHGDEQFICDTCGRIFKIKAALATHLNTHLPEKKYGCKECPKRYATKAALLRHVDREHRHLPPPCVCVICGKRYPRMSILKDHTKKVHGLLLMTRRCDENPAHRIYMEPVEEGKRFILEMFFKSLPTLTTTELEHAKVVLKSEVEAECLQEPLSPVNEPATSPVPTESTEPSQENEISEQVIFKQETEEDQDNSDSERIVLSEEVLQYMMSLQGAEGGEGCNFVVINNSDVTYVDGEGRATEMPSNIQIVMQEGGS